jgi:hypothetical protein
MERTFGSRRSWIPIPKVSLKTYRWFRQRVKKLENDPPYDYQMGSGQDN